MTLQGYSGSKSYAGLDAFKPRAYETTLEHRLTLAVRDGRTAVTLDPDLVLDRPPYQRANLIRIEPEDCAKVVGEGDSRRTRFQMGDGWSSPLIKNLMYVRKVQVNPCIWLVEDHRTAPYDRGSELYRFYTQDRPGLDLSKPAVSSKAREVSGGATDAVEVAWNVQKYISFNIEYEAASADMQYASAAVDVIESGRGDCSEFTTLFIAFCRSRGVPARQVHGSMYLPRERRTGGHTWAEIYLEGWGWIPVDPTVAHGKNPEFGFAKLDCNHIVEWVESQDVPLDPDDWESVKAMYVPGAGVEIVSSSVSYRSGEVLAALWAPETEVLVAPPTTAQRPVQTQAAPADGPGRTSVETTRTSAMAPAPKFCPECGKPVPQLTPPAKFCGFCGFQIAR